MRRKRIGVVLSGCGFRDGSEIHEATLTLLSLDRRGAAVTILAPQVKQARVVDHLSGKPAAGEGREVLVEAARIARGQVVALSTVTAGSLDGLILPGGFGAAQNLCTFAVDGARMRVDADLVALLRALHAAGKPLGFECIAPVIAASVFGGLHPRLTIGNDPETAAVLTELGARHVECAVQDIVLDPDLRIASTPAYMLGPSIAPVALGIDKLVGAVYDMA